MDYDDPEFLNLAYWGSNIVGVIFLIVAYRRPRIARLMFAALFGYAAWVNYNLSRDHPEAYLNYADRSVGVYANFINGWFRDHVTQFVTFISTGQLLIALGMLHRKTLVTLACAGAIAFLMGIAPLGYYAAFPFSVTVSAAAVFIIKKDDKDFLWRRNYQRSLHT